MKKIIALLLALTMALAMAACASKTEAPATTDTPKTEAPAATETPKTDAPAAETPKTEEPAADSDLAYIKTNGKMIIGYTVYEPMNYTDESGKFTGFDTEFAEAVCAKLGVTPEFQEINWDTKEIELAAKSLDCIWNGLTITADRQANMSISDPYVKNAQVIIVKKDSTIKSTADLVGKTVVAEIGSAGEAQITGEEPNADLAQAEYIGMGKQTDCLLEVKAGTADAAILDWTLAKSMVGEGTDYADLMMIDGLELATEEYGIAFRQGSDVTAAVNAAIAELVKDGTLPALAEKYGLALAPSIAG